MRIALLGAEGQLGLELQRQFEAEAIPLSHRDVEITDAQSVSAALQKVEPDLVINAAAYNQVDRAEQEPEKAYAVNALGPRNLAIFCQARRVPLVHISTDYVFSGRVEVDGTEAPRRMPYRETDRPEPISAYGVSKLAGECFVRTHCRQHLIVRTCGLYGRTRQPGTGNFVQTMLRLGKEQGEVRVVNDQTCTPTSTADLAQALKALIDAQARGLYHAVNAGSTTWYEFAREIFRLAGIKVDVQPISSAKFGAKARRPCYSVLDCSKLQKTVGFALPPWPEALRRYLEVIER